MTVSASSSPALLHTVLGPSPLVAGLGMWALGVLYCVSAWHINAAAPTLGLALMGLAPFVNLFCFFRGLTHLRRAWMRWRTSCVARRLHLSPTWGSGNAAFFMVDEAKGVCVVNGRDIDFADIKSLKSTSTFMAHTLELVQHNTAPRTPRLVIGFADADALGLATARLHLAMTVFTGASVPLTTEDLRTEKPFTS